ncbi:SatD family (SatD) [Ekhidna lutea]|uniref:SatD family (SatD) n=1 Tax=Ekhidna lutea TaxID=447679 RepID=A0A239GP51_EKHLU|nr:SatD family protein [Ekhidna lutea]SNS70937.1 SatD family (SatD) [Ekhidna lutea]
MEAKKRHILMADVVGSNQKDSNELMADFQMLVSYTNKIYRESIESPLTITLGDEFQGIVSSALVGIDIILAMEEYILEEEFDFKLRYVLYEGLVETPINPEVAHEMLGSGLTNARKRLNEMKKDTSRFYISTKSSTELNKMMKVTQHFIDGWHPKDRSTVSGFLQGHDYKALAKIHQKDESTLWRRRKSLAIDEYLLCKDLIHHLVSG